MQEDIANIIAQATVASRDAAGGWNRYGAFVGLDVHKDTIAVAIAMPGRDEPQFRGAIKHEPKALQR